APERARGRDGPARRGGATGAARARDRVAAGPPRRRAAHGGRGPRARAAALRARRDGRCDGGALPAVAAMRLGVIGCGAVTEYFHLPALAQLPPAPALW